MTEKEIEERNQAIENQTVKYDQEGDGHTIGNIKYETKEELEEDLEESIGDTIEISYREFLNRNTRHAMERLKCERYSNSATIRANDELSSLSKVLKIIEQLPDLPIGLSAQTP